VVQKRSFILLATVAIVLLISSLACSQSGRIITAAEATEMAKPTIVPTIEMQEGGPQVGDMVYLVNKSFLVCLMDAPGSNKMIAGQERGAQVEILQAADVDGVFWYFIDAPTGKGWVPETNISTEAP
jgi:hypothetical protein